MKRTREEARIYMRIRRTGVSTARSYRNLGLDWSDPVVMANYQRQYVRKKADIPVKTGRFEKLVAEYSDAVRRALNKVKPYSDLEPRQDRHCGGYSHNGHSVGGYHT